MSCRVAGCDGRHEAKGYCLIHYLRVLKYGVTELPKKLTGRDLIYSRIEIVGDCWLWVGSTFPTGYGQCGNDYAHRVSYSVFVGPIPDDLHIDHVRERGCRFRLCVNPAHLEPVTIAENNRRVTLTTCRKGLHPWTEENTYVRPDGRRYCRACVRSRRQKLVSA